MQYSGWELSYFDNSFNFREYQFSLIKKYINNNILEVGPGNGTLAINYLYKNFSRVHLTEINKVLYRVLKKKFKKKKIIIYNKKIQNIKKKFNTIIYSDVIEHIKKDKFEISNALKRLKKNGKLIIIVPAFQYLYSEYDKSIGHYRRYEKKFFINFAKINKVKISKIIYFDSVGYFFLLLKKLLKINHKKNIGIGSLLWNMLIPVSKVIDKIFINKIGKSILCVFIVNNLINFYKLN